MTEKHVYFVRHGETDSNADGVYRGADAALTGTGRAQAEAVADRIAQFGIDALIASPFSRTVDTANAIAAKTGHTIETNELFIETRAPGEFFGRNYDASEDLQQIIETIDSDADPHFRYSDEETFAESHARAGQALEFLATHPADALCVVTHGRFLRALFGVMLFGDRFEKPYLKDMMWRVGITNTGIVHARYTPDRGWKLISWNDHAHLG
ncbi:MAG TPA: histidine phosphatase family protein [Candidatus Paceibacterota bacterium]